MTAVSRPVWDKVAWMAITLCLAAGACKSDGGGKTPHAAAADRGANAPTPKPVAAGEGSARRGAAFDVPQVPTRYPAARRMAAIGDVHGDLEATRQALRLAGAIDEDDRWIGGDLVVVQTGDQLDRGDDEPEILALLDRLRVEAEEAGGELHVLNGNHEIMNAAGDFRYVTPEGFTDFENIEGLDLDDPRLARLAANMRPRAAAFVPGGPYAKILAHRNVAIIVGDTVFAHGGVLPRHTAKLEQLNDDVRRWLAAAHDEPRDVVEAIMAPDSPVWTRAYSDDVGPDDCAALDEALKALSARRMVVGHTVQKGGITSACDEKVWRIDVGMAEHYGGSPQALIIAQGRVSIAAPTEAGP